MNTNVGKMLYDIMDALVALRMDLKCDPRIGGEILVLSAERARAACEALDAASSSIRHILVEIEGADPTGSRAH